MLFWEALTTPLEGNDTGPVAPGARAIQPRRLPYDTRCAVVTKSGRRCKGRIRKGTEHCPLHDPAVAEQRRRRVAATGGRNHRRLTFLPDGYLRKLTNHAAVGNAMDRLYREARLGVINVEMGKVLFGILCRMMDSGLLDGRGVPRAPERTKAARLRPKLSELLTRAERAAWQKAVANAPAAAVSTPGTTSTERPIKLALQAAS